MKKLISSLMISVFTLMSASTTFAGEYDNTIKLEKSGGIFNIGSISVKVAQDSVETTTNLVSKEVSGMTPAFDSQKYMTDSKFVKLSLQDVSGAEIKLMTGATIVFNGVKSNYKNPVVLFNSDNTIKELKGTFVSVVNQIELEPVVDMNGTFIVADKLDVASTGNGVAETMVDNTMVISANGSMSGTTENVSGTGVSLEVGSENIQDRVKGSNTYLFLVGILVALYLSGVLMYRNV